MQSNLIKISQKVLWLHPKIRFKTFYLTSYTLLTQIQGFMTSTSFSAQSRVPTQHDMFPCSFAIQQMIDFWGKGTSVQTAWNTGITQFSILLSYNIAAMLEWTTGPYPTCSTNYLMLQVLWVHPELKNLFSGLFLCLFVFVFPVST